MSGSSRSSVRPTVILDKNVEANVILGEAKLSAVKQFAKTVFLESMKRGETELIEDLLAASPQFQVMYQKHITGVKEREETRVLKGRSCIGYYVTWNPPKPLSDSYEETLEKFGQLAMRDWVEGKVVFTVDQRGETKEEVNGFHIHSYWPKGQHQNYQYTRFLKTLQNHFGQTNPHTLNVRTIGDLQNRSNVLNYINYQKSDDKASVVETTLAYIAEDPDRKKVYTIENGKFFDEQNEEENSESDEPYRTPFDDDEESVNSYISFN